MPSADVAGVIVCYWWLLGLWTRLHQQRAQLGTSSIWIVVRFDWLRLALNGLDMALAACYVTKVHTTATRVQLRNTYVSVG